MKTDLKRVTILLSISLISLLFSQCNSVHNDVSVNHLQCEYATNPISIDEPQPRFTWQLASDKDSVLQYAYQISVASSPVLLKEGNPDIWQSDKRTSNLQRTSLDSLVNLKSFQRYYWNVKVWTNLSTHPAISATASFETAMMSKSDWKAQWITDSNHQDFEPAPLFRKVFETADKKDIDYARLYISGLGYYEAFINGMRVGENYLDPSYTAFDKRVYYVVHDVTNLLSAGKNTISTVLGNGWYNEQSVAVWDFHKADWRNRPMMICELHIHYSDGTIDKLNTDTSWKTNSGAYTYNNLYSGDMYDARLEESGWQHVGFDDSKWNQAIATTSDAPIFRAQKQAPIQITKELAPITFNKINDSLYVYDFGENFSGFSKIKVKGERGTKLHIKHGELLDSLGLLQQGNIDVYYHPTQEKEIFQTNVFTLKGDDGFEEFQPSFTYHGFQYVQIESDRPIELTKESVKGLFINTNVAQVGTFSCSNETLNKLWRATNQSYLSNLHSIPTDCPQREKNGWTADAHISVEAGLLNYDGILLYEKWMNDFIDNQRENGMISGIIPSSGWGFGNWPGPVWDAALFIIPHELYNYYNDTHTIQRMYPTMERYLHYLQEQENKAGLLDYGLGDWLTYNAQTPNEFTSSAYYYLDNKLMAQFARLLDKDATLYAKKAELLKELINKKFYNPTTNIYANGSQTSQALALYLGLVAKEDEQKAANNLADSIKSNNGFLDFGLLGTKTVPRILTKYGYGELALKLITRPDAPSWGHWVDSLGYTTLPETWTLSPQFKDASLNHMFFGDISAWMYQYLAGINYDSNEPGFNHIIIEPYFIEGIDWVKADYNSAKGIIRSEWTKEGSRVKLTVTIPTGSTATVSIGGSKHTIGSGKKSFDVDLGD